MVTLGWLILEGGIFVCGNLIQVQQLYAPFNMVAVLLIFNSVLYSNQKTSKICKLINIAHYISQTFVTSCTHHQHNVW